MKIFREDFSCVLQCVDKSISQEINVTCVV
jgi:hypothetical protein